MKKLLIVVDVQRDFYHPEGALYVPGAEKKVPEIEKIIPDFDAVAFTMDWHPMNHCSFKEFGGEWPAHCVAETEGAGIPYSLLKAAKDPVIVKKATEAGKEEYGAFSGIGSIYYKKEDIWYGHSTFLDLFDEVVVCGIAAEYCVFNTVKNIKRLISLDPGTVLKVYLDGVAHFDPKNKVLEEYMEKNGIEEYK